MHNHLLDFSLHLEHPSTQLLALNTTLRKITQNKTKETKILITKDYKNTTFMVLKQKFAMALFTYN